MKQSNLLNRVIVAIIFIPIIYFIIIKGGFYFFLFVTIISSLSLYEYYKLSEKKGVKPIIWIGILFNILLQFSFLYERVKYLILNYLANYGIFPYYPTQFVILLGLIALFVFLVIILELFRNNGSPLLNISTTIFGFFYISLFLGMLIATRELFEWENFNSFFLTHSFKELLKTGNNVYEINSKDWGGLFIFSTFVTIWICDSAAYFVGKGFGKRKLFERVSPNKTWEGALAGFIFSIISMFLLKIFVITFLPLWHSIIIGIIIGVFGQIGDLCQSLIKRDAGVKDSSSIIPGHGGVFDRFDSIIFISPLLYLYVDLVVLYI